MGPNGFRRGRRRGLIVGAAVGASAAKSSQRRAEQASAAAQPAAPAPTNTNEQFAQLEQLAKLKDQGILTQAEFDAKKQQILGL